ncbi:mechanosensitive ion channel protein [Lewinellaceae bacterium SD302]|nr:mechanosensitive ion channel protein [Lewinellaceae bacterium SD302]
MDQLETYLGEDWKADALAIGTNVLLALLIIIVGFWVAGRLGRLLEKQLQKSKTDPTVINFAKSLVSTGLKILVILVAASQFGIEVTSFIAILSAMAFAIGLALQGTLGHFASGVLLLFFRPYKVGDLVTIGSGQTGTVEELQIFNTILVTLDNKRIIVPNGQVTSNVITNISGQGVIGVELTFGIGYGDDIDKARGIILRVGEECPYILSDPAQGVVVAELADSSVNLATRPFCKSIHYWDTFFYMQENVKKAFDRDGINIPFPQMDVHMQS